jgi:anaerobic magnesium-protoporphyrin IX monomethyl ester cyclase
VNLGVCYIASVLNKNGHDAKIYNADYLNKDSYADQIQMLNNFCHYKEIHEQKEHFIWLETVDTIIKYKPDYIGLSIFTANLPAAKIIAEHIKKRASNIKIIVGGSHVTLEKEEILEESEYFDFAVYGEGEYATLQLMNDENLECIDNLIYRNKEVIKKNKPASLINNLDVIPFPDRNNFFPESIKYPSHFVMTSRGCPNNCTFCASPVIWGRKVRFRSVNNVIEELKILKENGYSYIQFIDDTFTFKKKRLLKLLNRMISENFNFEWVCDTRLVCIDQEIIKKMKKAGCVRVKVGIESGNRKILSSINKGLTPELVIEKVNLIKKEKLSVAAYFMIGFPGETSDEAIQTIELAKKLDIDYYSLSIVAPYYGTEIYDKFLDENTKNDIKQHWEYFFHQSKEMILTDRIDETVINEFLSLNDYGKGNRL